MTALSSEKNVKSRIITILATFDHRFNIVKKFKDPINNKDNVPTVQLRVYFYYGIRAFLVMHKQTLTCIYPLPGDTVPISFPSASKAWGLVSY